MLLFFELFLTHGKKKVNNNEIFWQIKTPLDLWEEGAGAKF